MKNDQESPGLVSRSAQGSMVGDTGPDGARLVGLRARHLRPAAAAMVREEDELVIYPKAGHLILASYVPTEAGSSRFGGTPEANEDSWDRAPAFLDRNFGRWAPAAGTGVSWRARSGRPSRSCFGAP